MAVVHRSRGAGLVYGLGGYEDDGRLGDVTQKSYGGGTGANPVRLRYPRTLMPDYGFQFGLSGYDGGAGFLGAVRGDIDPATGKVFDGAVWVTPNDGESENLSTAYKSYMNDPFVGMSEADKALYWAGQGGGGTSAFFAPAGTTSANFDAAAQAATQANADAYMLANAGRLAELTALVRGAEATELAQQNYKYDYVAQSGGDLATWFSLAYPERTRYSTVNGSILDNALLTYQASVAGGQNMTSLAASAAQAQAASDDRYQYSLTHGGFSDAATNPNAKPISVAPGTATATGKTIGTTADGKTVVWNQTTQKWDPVAGSAAFMGANAGSAGAPMPSAGGGSDYSAGGGGYGGGIEAGGGGAVGALVAGMPGGWLGVLALVGAVVVSQSSSRGRRRR